jgi:2-C-methyl-D-erythritol 4-phosphate cytidylyltransferase
MAEVFDAVIVAAGSGKRLGYDIPKAFVPLGKKPLLAYSVETFLVHSLLSQLILVVPEAFVKQTQMMFDNKSITVIAGGSERWKSVYNGCNRVHAEWVLVHDAARPFVTTQVIDALLEKRSTFQCAISATLVVDTIRTFDKNIAGPSIDRSKLIRVGTPQIFRTSLLQKAFSTNFDHEAPPTDEAVLVQKMGYPVGIADGDSKNFKITTKEDLEIAEALINNLSGSNRS